MNLFNFNGNNFNGKYIKHGKKFFSNIGDFSDNDSCKKNFLILNSIEDDIDDKKSSHVLLNKSHFEDVTLNLYLFQTLHGGETVYCVTFGKEQNLKIEFLLENNSEKISPEEFLTDFLSMVYSYLN